jgi:hypothetical protein
MCEQVRARGYAAGCYVPLHLKAKLMTADRQAVRCSTTAARESICTENGSENSMKNMNAVNDAVLNAALTESAPAAGTVHLR